MRVDDDNPPYLTVVELFGAFHVNLMEYNQRADDYQISVSKQYSNKTDALLEAWTWSKRDGVEIR